MYNWDKKRKKKRNVMSIIFSQQILNDMLLLTVTSRQKSNLSCGFKLQPITTYYLYFILLGILHKIIMEE